MAAAAASFFFLQLRHDTVITSQKMRLFITNVHAWARSKRFHAQQAAAPLSFQCDVHVTSCQMARCIFTFVHTCHQLDNGGASSPSSHYRGSGGPPRQMEVSFGWKARGFLEKLSRPPTETLCVLRKRHEHRDGPFVHLVRIKRRTHSSLTAHIYV